MLQKELSELEKLGKRIEKLESENKKLKEVLLSAKIIKSIQYRSFPYWIRYYHTDQNWLDHHNQEHKSEYTLENEWFGYALTEDPKKILTE